jgi:hypothetical protein
MAGYTRQSTFADGDTITAALFNNEYNQLLNAFSNTGGHKHDGTAAEGPVIGLIGDAGETSPNNKVLIDTTNNYIEFYVEVSSASVQQLYIADGAIIPVTDSDIDLGTTSLRFKDTYTDTITTTGNVSVGGNLTVTGNATISGNLTFGDADTDSINLAAEIDSHIVPNTDDTYDLGTSTKQWRNLYIDGTAEIDTLTINGTTVTSTAAELNILDGVTSTAAELNILDGVTSTTAELNILDGVTATAAEINLLDGVTSTTAELNILDGVTATAAELNTLDGITSTVAELNILDGVTASATDINLIDGITNGTVIASKAIVTDANKDISGGRNITITGELDAATLDISGNADIDGTLETDALSINGTTVTSTAAELNILDGVTSTAAELNLLDGVTATTAELNILDGVTSTAAEINLLDGVTATTAELNILDGVTSTAAELNILDGKAFLDEDDMSSNSATGIASQQSIKAYVDTQITAEDLDITTDSGTIAIDLDSETLTVSGGTGLDSSATGNAVTLAIDSTVATLTGSQTLTNKSLTAPTLTGTTVVASLDISGDIDVDGTTNLDVVDIDGAVDFASTTAHAGNATFTDNAKAIFGAGSDLEIYHDGSNSYVNEQGTGSLYLNTTNGAGVFLTSAGENLAQFNSNGAVTLYHDNSAKLATTSTGVDVTGTATATNMQVSNGGKYIFGGENTRITGETDGNGKIRLFTGGTEKVILDGSNVGIGTSSPVDKLQITTSGAGSPYIGFNQINDNVYMEMQRWSGVASTYYGTRLKNITGNFAFETTDLANVGSQTFTEKMRIDASGNVGIGTDNPTVGKLQVNDGSGAITAITRTSGSTSGDLGTIRFGNTDVDSNLVNIVAFQDGATNSGALKFETQAAGGATAERMRIDSSGRLMVGQTSAYAPSGSGVSMGTFEESSDSRTNLVVSNQNSGSSAGSSIVLASHGSDYIIENQGSGKGGALTFTRGTTEHIRLDSSGNVSIGTTSTTAPLRVKVATDANFAVQNTSSTVQLQGINDAANAFTTIDIAGNPIKFSANGSESMRIDSSGNVGIGASPSSTIRNDITSAEKALQIGNRAMFFSDGGVTTDLQNNSHLDNSNNRVAMQTDLGSLYQQYQGIHKWFNAASVSAGATQTMTERMRIDASGNVGIGISSPSAKLHVVETNTNTIVGKIKSSTSASYLSFEDNSTTAGQVRVGAIGNEFVINAGGATAVRIDSNQNVGIGTSSPSAKLHVANAATEEYIFETTSNNTRSQVEVKSKDSSGNAVQTRIASMGDGVYGMLYTLTNHNLSFATNNSAPQMTLDTSGNVGIGETSPLGKLHVKSGDSGAGVNVNADELVVESSGTAGITILSGTSGDGNIFFDDSGGFARGKLSYSHNGDYLSLLSSGASIFYNSGSERMRIASSGAVGIGTTSLGTEATLHIGIPSGAGGAEGGQLILQSSSNGSKALHMDNYNNASVDYCRFMRGSDTTSEAVLGAWDITNVSYLVGKAADINTDNGVALRADGGARFTAGGTSSFIQLAFFRNGSASEVGSITTTSSATAYNTSSDYRLKENVDYTWDATTRLKQLKPARFNFIADETNTLVDGFIAHEVQDIVPEAITGEKDGDKMQGIDQSKLVPLLTKAIQEQQAQIEALQSEINKLKGE